LLLILKNARGLLLPLLLPHLLYLVAEALASLILLRHWPFVRRAYLSAVRDAWACADTSGKSAGNQPFSQAWRFLDAAFLRLKPSRWEEVERAFQAGIPGWIRETEAI